MARLVGSVAGHLVPAVTLGPDLGPTGLAWNQSTFLNPSSLFKLTSDPDYLAATVSLVGSLSLWVYTPNSTKNDLNMFIHFPDSVGIRTWVEIGLSGGFPSCRLLQPINTLVVSATGTTQTTAGDWNHILMSWDLASGNPYASSFHMYLNDVDVKPVTPTTFITGSPVEWGTGNLFTTNYRLNIGNLSDPAIGFSAIWLDWFRYIDFSVEGNRRLFRTVTGGQRPLGLDGSLPTGFQPPLYIDNPAASIVNNRGIVGTFTIGAGGTIVDFTPTPPVG